MRDSRFRSVTNPCLKLMAGRQNNADARLEKEMGPAHSITHRMMAGKFVDALRPSA
ncbi:MULTISPECIES: hypothetical protein [Aureimonas]|uniref:hypothetical protein n=1 Tax=Aureimonas TaxID=414371 RepID=UPI0012E36FF0|nr:MULTISPECIES: hypothetical protein [Aureimonas]